MPNKPTALTLLLLALLLTLSNIYYAARRSTIPLALDTRVASKQVLGEKHPGKDDVYILQFADGAKLQVDREVFRRVRSGDRLRKNAWETRLQHNDQSLALRFSSDVRGLLWVMLSALAITMIVLAFSIRPHTDAPD